MGAYTISIFDLVSRAFGAGKIPVYAGGEVNRQQGRVGLGSVEIPKVRFSPLQKYEAIASEQEREWGRVSFLEGQYRDGQRIVEYKGLSLPEATLVSFDLTKTIVKTPVAGLNGSVKELISAEDWRVEIQGILTTGCLLDTPELNGDAYPMEEVQAVCRLCDLPTSLEVVGELFAIRGIYRLVIERVSFPKLEGFPNVQPFVLSCLSDTPMELELKSVGIINQDL